MEGNGIALVPGQYKTPGWYGVPLSFEFSDESWKVITLERSELLAFVQGESEVGYATRWLILLPVYDDEAKALEDEMLTAPGFDFIAGPERREIGENSGTLMVLQAQPNPEFAATDESVAGVRELTVLQAPRRQLGVADFDARGDGGADHVRSRRAHALGLHRGPADEFEAFAQEAQAVLAAVKPLQ